MHQKGDQVDYLVAPSAFSCLKAAFALSVVCLLKVATLTYASLPEASAGPTELLAEAHMWEVTGFSVMRCLVSFTALDLLWLLTSRVTYMHNVDLSHVSCIHCIADEDQFINNTPKNITDVCYHGQASMLWVGFAISLWHGRFAMLNWLIRLISFRLFHEASIQ